MRNLPAFTRFFLIAALFHGQAINAAGIARDSGIARTTVSGYLDILEDTLLTHRLPAYESKLRVRERKHPKLYWVDPGVVRAAKRQLGSVTAEEQGPLLEGFILTLLRAAQERHRIYEELTFWSPHQSAVEVALLLRRGHEFLAIEVKAATRFTKPLVQGCRRSAISRISCAASSSTGASANLSWMAASRCGQSRPCPRPSRTMGCGREGAV